MSGETETLDIEVVISRWEEIMDRIEAGETVIVLVDGLPKARLEPIPSIISGTKTS